MTETTPHMLARFAEPPRLIHKTTGIVLRISPFSRTSHIVTWLTPDAGKVTTVTKGATRPKSAFLGQYDLFYTCELLYYARERNGVHVIRECSPTRPRTPLRRNWRGAVCASYLCDLTSLTTGPGVSTEAHFDLLDRSLDAAEDAGTGSGLIHWFELQAFRASGFAPRLDACIACEASLASDPTDGALFSIAGGGILCSACVGQDRTSASPLHADALAIMREWQDHVDPFTVPAAGSRAIIEIGKTLGSFLEYHLPVMPRGRRIALEMLQ